MRFFRRIITHLFQGGLFEKLRLGTQHGPEQGIQAAMCKSLLAHALAPVPPAPCPQPPGLHTVADIYCNVCNTNLGWKYEMAYEQSQKYKEGERNMTPSLYTVLAIYVIYMYTNTYIFIYRYETVPVAFRRRVSGTFLLHEQVLGTGKIRCPIHKLDQSLGT